MGFKAYFKRMLRYIVKGPEIIVKENRTTTDIYVSAPNERLKNKSILITGGGSGLGFAIAKKAVEEGATVVITGRNEQKLIEKATIIGAKCKYYVCDMTLEADVDSLLFNIESKLGITYFDNLVCNAGISLHEGELLNVTKSDFDKQINTNLKGNYFLAQTYIKKCINNQNKTGDILFISSERGLQADDLPYGLTKAAINSFVKGINKRYLQQGIRANAICPGVTCSEMTGFSTNDNLYVDYNNIHRVMLPEEIAETAVFLMSSASRCISGEVIACDYGNYFCSIY